MKKEIVRSPIPQFFTLSNGVNHVIRGKFTIDAKEIDQTDTLADSPASRIWKECFGLLPRDKSCGYLSAAPPGLSIGLAAASHETHRPLPPVLSITFQRLPKGSENTALTPRR